MVWGQFGDEELPEEEEIAVHANDDTVVPTTVMPMSLSGFIDDAGNFLGDVQDSIDSAEDIVNDFDNIVDGISNAVQDGTNAVDDVLSNVDDFVDNAVDAASNFADATEGVFHGLFGATANLANAFVSNDLFMNGAKPSWWDDHFPHQRISNLEKTVSKFFEQHFPEAVILEHRFGDLIGDAKRLFNACQPFGDARRRRDNHEQTLVQDKKQDFHETGILGDIEHDIDSFTYQIGQFVKSEIHDINDKCQCRGLRMVSFKMLSFNDLLNLVESH